MSFIITEFGGILRVLIFRDQVSSSGAISPRVIDKRPPLYLPYTREIAVNYDADTRELRFYILQRVPVDWKFHDG